MKYIANERQTYYKNSMLKRLADDLKGLDEVERKHIDEVVNAIALGCCLQKARVFSGQLMSAEDFREIANAAQFELFCIPVQAMAREQKKGHVIRNRIWYILGILATIGPVLQSKTRPAHSDHKERVYSDEELRGIVRDLSSFTDADL